MKEVNEGKIEEIVKPKHVDGGEEGFSDPDHGQGNDAAHQESEQGPVVKQGWILAECEQVPLVPVLFLLHHNHFGSASTLQKASTNRMFQGYNSRSTEL